MKSRFISASIFAISSLVLSQAQADDSAFYVGLSYGKSTIETGVSNLTGTATLDEEDNGSKIFVGYDLNDMVSIEGHYANLGEAVLTGNNGDQFTVAGTVYAFTANNVAISTEGKSIGISSVLKLPLSDTVEPFLKLGVHNWDVSASVTSSAGNASLSDDGTDIFYGIGIGISLTDSLSIRGEFERYDFDGDDADYLSLGLAYNL